jgi:hypothetical protein
MKGRMEIMDFVIFVYFAITMYLAIQKKIKFSTALLPLLLFSILANVALAQNYTQSLIPEANDGLGISNWLAYFLIGEDRWSQEKFLSSYNFSTNFAMVLLFSYSNVLIIEKALVFKKKSKMAA